MFSVVKSNARKRFLEVFANLAFIESIEPKELQVETPLNVKIARGLYYVHLYAALEKSINETVEQAILLIGSKNVKNAHFKSQFNVLSLNPKVRALKDSGYSEYFRKSTEIFNGLDSELCFKLEETMFGNSLQNVWYKTIEEILGCFGIPLIAVEARVILTLNEVTDKRNAVAHGRENPAIAGERHSSTILRIKTQEIQQVVDLFIDSFESYISNLHYLKDDFRTLYATQP